MCAEIKKGIKKAPPTGSAKALYYIVQNFHNKKR
jgi:hypothetical protein